MTAADDSRNVDGGALLSALTVDLQHSYDLAERLDSKTQRLATFAGAFFALVQAAAVSSLLKDLSRTEKIVLLALCLLALFSLALAGFALLRQERLLTVGELPLEQIERLVNSTFGEDRTRPPEDVNLRLAKIYSGMARSRRLANKERVRRYKVARIGFGLTILVTSIELGWAVFARIPGVNI